MAWPLKQSTSATILLGPFVDSTDGNTEETGLTINASDVKLWKAGGTTWAAKNDATAATHRANGMYTVPVDATDTNTLGPGRIGAHVSGALWAWADFVVYPANVYDSLFAGSDKLQVDSVELNSSTTSAARLATAAATMITGTVQSDAGNSATAFKTDLTAGATDYIVGRILIFTSGTLAGQASKVSDFQGSTDIVTVTDAYTTTPTASDAFIIV
jgi:hypothetical protein